MEQYDKKNVFRTVRGIELREPCTEEEFNRIVKTVDAKEIEDNSELYNMTHQDCEERINTLMTAIKGQKQYASELRELRYVRLRMFKFLQLSQYIEFLRQHIENMKEIFTARMDSKKIPGILKSRVLLPIELRILEMKGYESIPIDTNEVSLLKTYLRYRWGFSKILKPFDKDRVINLYGCYNIALFNVADYIKIILPNKYGLNNLIYLDVPKSTNDDPFSFYYLEQINKTNDAVDVRHWIMDCRLDDLVGDIVHATLEFSINLYRKIYHAIYHDNVYRVDTGDSQILEFEAEQLIQNIVIMSDYTKFNMMIRQIIKEKCKYIPTKYDKFNLYSDDPINRRRLKKSDNDLIEKEIIKNIKRLFDTIDDNQLTSLYHTVINKL